MELDQRDRDSGVWDLLPHLITTPRARREASGGITAPRRRRSLLLYGPHWWLREGAYRLAFACRARSPRMPSLPVLGIEIIVQNRIQQLWQDFTAAELGSTTTLDFVVDAAFGLEHGQESRYEFKFYDLANAALAFDSIELRRIGEPLPRPLPEWRLLGRLSRSWPARWRGNAIEIGRNAPRGVILEEIAPPLRLPAGSYRVQLVGRATSVRRSQAPAVAIEIVPASTTPARRRMRRLVEWRAASAPPMARAEFHAEALANATFCFAVPEELSLEAGADFPIDVRVRHFGNADITLQRLTLMRSVATASPLAAPAVRRHPLRSRIVVVGNCQADIVCEGFRRAPALDRRFDVTYHFAKLHANLHEAGRKDLAQCDVLLAQDIADWEEYPLRGDVPGHTRIVKFPMLRFASLWPFDHYNGPRDREAYEREWPNLTFANLDWLLARLRHEIADREVRFAAYRKLETAGVVNYLRLHEHERKRLLKVDEEFGFEIGRYILDNFQRRQVFYTTIHPNGQVMAMLMADIMKKLGLDGPYPAVASLDQLADIQVPVHPKVAAALGVEWADENRKYAFHGEWITWETYTRRYIDHYG